LPSRLLHSKTLLIHPGSTANHWPSAWTPRNLSGKWRSEAVFTGDAASRLLNLRLLEEITTETFAKKSTELRDRIADVALRIEAVSRGRSEQAELAIRTFEPAQSGIEMAYSRLFSETPHSRNGVFELHAR
jgi:hypothetical protein